MTPETPLEKLAEEHFETHWGQRLRKSLSPDVVDLMHDLFISGALLGAIEGGKMAAEIMSPLVALRGGESL